MFGRLSEKYFLKAIEHIFRVYIASPKTLIVGVGELEKFSKARKPTASRVCMTASNSPNPHPLVFR